jgi:hypothetical protein
MSYSPIGRAMSDQVRPRMSYPIPHTEFGIRKLEMLMPWHRMMERLGVGQRPRAVRPWMERSERNPLPTFSCLTRDDGAVWWARNNEPTNPYEPSPCSLPASA